MHWQPPQKQVSHVALKLEQILLHYSKAWGIRDAKLHAINKQLRT
jgi:hypothetical protein